MRFSITGLVVAAVFVGNALAVCDGVVDQINDTIDPGDPASNYHTQCQTFTPTMPLLEAVELRLRAGWSYPGPGATFHVRIRQGSFDGPVLGEKSLFVPGPLDQGAVAFYRFEFDTCLDVTPGEMIVIETWDFPSGEVASWSLNVGNKYLQGGWSSNCQGEPSDTADFHFITYGASTSLDVPAVSTWGALLLVAVLLGLSVFRINRKSRVRPDGM